jgi:hypothetical protein
MRVLLRHPLFLMRGGATETEGGGYRDGGGGLQRRRGGATEAAGTGAGQDRDEYYEGYCSAVLAELTERRAVVEEMRKVDPGEQCTAL